jgi:L-threonylcarbamoyladenylate synthase
MLIKKITKGKGKTSAYLKVSHDQPDMKSLLLAANILKSGGVIIYPTDTLYGFGASIAEKEALSRIQHLKKRDKNKPFSLLISEREEAEKIIGKITPKERKIFDLLFPGKITLLIKTRKRILIPGLEKLDKIGFRIPDSQLCRNLVKLSGTPISSSSVNISKRNNLGKIEDIRFEFGNKVDLILDGGPVKSLKGSSILDISVFPPVLVREGEVSKEELEKKLQLNIKTNTARKFIITFICSGNICRSPMAEGMMRKKLDKEIFKKKVEINSAGTLNLPSTAASIETVTVASEHEIDLNNHLSRYVDPLIIDQTNLVFCMAENHYDYLRQKYPVHHDKIHLLKSYENKKIVEAVSIADPIGKSEEFYRQIYDEIEREIDRILPFVMKKILKYVYKI